jgi:hypothetical protein
MGRLEKKETLLYGCDPMVGTLCQKRIKIVVNKEMAERKRIPEQWKTTFMPACMKL